jgi:hypothetical protein
MVPELMTGPLPTITRTLVTARSGRRHTPGTANDAITRRAAATRTDDVSCHDPAPHIG